MQLQKATRKKSKLRLNLSGPAGRIELRKADYKTAMWNCPDWKPITGYEGLYEIHWRGAVRNAETKLLLKPGLAGNGYLTVSLYKDKNGKTHTLHVLNAFHFTENPENKKCVNHKDGIKINVHNANLEWATHGENNSHALMTGLKTPIYPARGIIQLDMNGNEIARYRTSEEVPAQFSPGCVCLVANGKRNSHGGFKWKFIN